MDKLTNKEKTFIKEYVKTLNGELSAVRAGYKKSVARQKSEEILSNNFVINAIKKELTKQISTFQVKKAYVVQKLLKIAEFSLEEEDIFDKEGNITGKKLRDTTAGLKALESLGKYLGLMREEDKNSHETKIVTIKNLDDKKI